MAATGDERRGTPPADAWGRDAGLLSLSARIAGLDAVAVVVTGPAGALVHASWPEDAAGTQVAGGPEHWAALLEGIGGSGGRLVSASTEVEDGVVAALVGSVDPAAVVDAEEAASSLGVLVELLGSRLGLQSARVRAEDARTRMASLVQRGPLAGPGAGPGPPAHAHRAGGP